MTTIFIPEFVDLVAQANPDAVNHPFATERILHQQVINDLRTGELKFLNENGLNKLYSNDIITKGYLDQDAAIAWLTLRNLNVPSELSEEEKINTPANASVQGDNSGPLPLTTGDIAFCFDGLHWSEQEWRKPLGDKPKWLQACVHTPGQRGVSETRWNPVSIGAALVRDGHALANSVRARFQTKDLLKPWLDSWQTFEADNLTTE
jgi:hypothetical protein